MKEQQNKIFQAGAVRTGLTKSKTRSQTLYKLGQNLGITQDDIKKTVRRKKVIQTCAMIIVATVAAGYSYMLTSAPLHYTGAGMKDFDIFARMMYTAFGRVF